MLKLEQVKLRPEQPESELSGKAAQLLRIPPEELLSLSVLRRAVDARAPLQLVYTLADGTPLTLGQGSSYVCVMDPDTSSFTVS